MINANGIQSIEDDGMSYGVKGHTEIKKMSQLPCETHSVPCGGGNQTGIVYNRLFFLCFTHGLVRPQMFLIKVGPVVLNQWLKMAIQVLHFWFLFRILLHNILCHF